MPTGVYEHNKGVYKHSIETRKKISLGNKNKKKKAYIRKPHSIETKLKIRISLMGRKFPNRKKPAHTKGVHKINMVCDVCKKNFQSYATHRKYKTVHCSQKCAGVSNGKRRKGKPMNPETTKKMIKTKRENGSFIFSEEHKNKISEAHRKMDISGEKNWNWKGGVNKSQAIRKTAPYKDWRKSVFERDDYTCQICFKRGIKIHADHIKRFSDYPELRLELSNGRTLCVPCHMKTDTWGSRGLKKNEKQINTIT